MVKLIIFLLGLAIGFGSAVWWSAAHPEDAQKLAIQERARADSLQQKVNDLMHQK